MFHYFKTADQKVGFLVQRESDGGVRIIFESRLATGAMHRHHYIIRAAHLAAMDDEQKLKFILDAIESHRPHAVHLL